MKTVLAISLFFLWSADAGAAPKVPASKADMHRFAGARLKGQLKKPEMSYIYERKGLRVERIVNVPENFNEEIIDGAGQF